MAQVAKSLRCTSFNYLVVNKLFAFRPEADFSVLIVRSMFEKQVLPNLLLTAVYGLSGVVRNAYEKE